MLNTPSSDFPVPMHESRASASSHLSNIYRFFYQKRSKIFVPSISCYLYLIPSSFLQSYTITIFIPPSSTYSPAPCLSGYVGQAYLCSSKHSFIRCHPPLPHPALLPLICCPSHLSALSPFLRLFPISSAQMRCCIQRRVCPFLIASCCASIRWKEIGLKWNVEYCCANTHSQGLQVYLCGKWLIKVTLVFMVLYWPLSSLLVILFILLLSLDIHLPFLLFVILCTHYLVWGGVYNLQVHNVCCVPLSFFSAFTPPPMSSLLLHSYAFGNNGWATLAPSECTLEPFAWMCCL